MSAATEGRKSTFAGLFILSEMAAMKALMDTGFSPPPRLMISYLGSWEMAAKTVPLAMSETYVKSRVCLPSPYN